MKPCLSRVPWVTGGIATRMVRTPRSVNPASARDGRAGAGVDRRAALRVAGSCHAATTGKRQFSDGEAIHAEHRNLALRIEQDVGHRDAFVVLDVDVARRDELSAVVGREPEHLIDLQEDIDLCIGQAVDLGLGDIAAHADGVHLQVNPTPA
jgi:hypothetical protein